MRTVALASLAFVLGCGETATREDAVARVNDAYLLRQDIADLVPEGTPKADSMAMVRHYIDKWAAQKLLLDAADINLNDARKAEFDQLVNRYREDLYTGAYLDEVVRQKVDTAISEAELRAFYEAGKENFKTTGVLVRLRYIRLRRDNPKLGAIRSRFFNFRKSDAKFWETERLGFTEASLNDSVWVEMSQVYPRLPFINPDNRDRYIRSGNSIEYPDSTGVYLVKIAAVIDRNQIGPFEYLKPTLREVILNQRKLELIKKFEKDITDDAIKEKKYEVFE